MLLQSATVAVANVPDSTTGIATENGQTQSELTVRGTVNKLKSSLQMTRVSINGQARGLRCSISSDLSVFVQHVTLA